MAKPRKLLNPRGYLSHTQIDMWIRSPERYVRNYMLGQGYDLQNSGIIFGKKASDALENGAEEDDAAMEALVALLPRYSAREHEIRAPLETPGGTVVLLGKLDTFDPKTLRFREYKTGVVPWTQSKAEKSNQLRQYATLIWLKHGKLPPEAHLDWAETERTDGETRLTGKIRTFPVTLGMTEVLEHMALVAQVAKEIDVRYRAEMAKLV